MAEIPRRLARPSPHWSQRNRRHPQEGLLALDAAKVAEGVGVPAAALEVAVVAGAGDRQGLPAVQVLAAGAGGPPAGPGGAGGGGEVQVDPAERVDDGAEPVEVDQQVVVDRDAELGLDGLDELGGAAGEGGVDLAAPAGLSEWDQQVAGGTARHRPWCPSEFGASACSVRGNDGHAAASRSAGARRDP